LLMDSIYLRCDHLYEFNPDVIFEKNEFLSFTFTWFYSHSSVD